MSSSSDFGVLPLVPPVFILAWTLAWLAIAVAPRWRWLSQWQLTLDDKGIYVDQCYGSIYAATRARSLPVAAEPVRIQRAQNQPPANYLRLRQGDIHAYIGVFSYGSGLFMTWSMWKRQTAIGLMLSVLSDRLQGASIFQQVVRSDPDRALREAVHGVVREGVEAAISGRGPSLTEAFGVEPPVRQGRGGPPLPAGSPSVTPDPGLPPFPPPSPAPPVHPPVSPGSPPSPGAATKHGW